MAHAGRDIVRQLPRGHAYWPRLGEVYDRLRGVYHQGFYIMLAFSSQVCDWLH